MHRVEGRQEQVAAEQRDRGQGCGGTPTRLARAARAAMCGSTTDPKLQTIPVLTTVAERPSEERPCRLPDVDDGALPVRRERLPGGNTVAFGKGVTLPGPVG